MFGPLTPNSCHTAFPLSFIDRAASARMTLTSLLVNSAAASSGVPHRLRTSTSSIGQITAESPLSFLLDPPPRSLAWLFHHRSKGEGFVGLVRSRATLASIPETTDKSLSINMSLRLVNRGGATSEQGPWPVDHIRRQMDFEPRHVAEFHGNVHRIRITERLVRCRRLRAPRWLVVQPVKPMSRSSESTPQPQRRCDAFPVRTAFREFETLCRNGKVSYKSSCTSVPHHGALHQPFALEPSQVTPNAGRGCAERRINSFTLTLPFAAAISGFFRSGVRVVSSL